MPSLETIERRRIAARAKAKRRYHSNPIRRALEIQRAKAWYENHRTDALARMREWQRLNPGRVRATKLNVRARRAAQTSSWTMTADDYAALIIRDVMCYLCGLPNITAQNSIDHVIPLAKNGPHVFENLRVVHNLCNLRKAAKLVPPL